MRALNIKVKNRTMVFLAPVSGVNSDCLIKGVSEGIKILNEVAGKFHFAGNKEFCFNIIRVYRARLKFYKSFLITNKQ